MRDYSAVHTVLYGIERVANRHNYDLVFEVNSETDADSEMSWCVGYIVFRNQVGSICGTPLKFTMYIHEFLCRGTIYFFNSKGLFTSMNLNLYEYSTLSRVLNFLDTRFQSNKVRRRSAA